MFSIILLLSLMVQPFAAQNYFSVIGTVRDDGGNPVTSIRVSLEELVALAQQRKLTYLTLRSGEKNLDHPDQLPLWFLPK